MLKTLTIALLLTFGGATPVLATAGAAAANDLTTDANDERIAINRFTREAFSETMRSDNIYGEPRGQDETRYYGKPGEPLVAMRTFYFKSRDRKSLCHAGIRIDRTSKYGRGDHTASVGMKCLDHERVTYDTVVSYLIQTEGGGLQHATLIATPLKNDENITADRQ